MADIEKVKRGLAYCADGCATDCPYTHDCRCGKNLSIDSMTVIEELQAEIERLQPRWIPVSERLPEEEGGYIAYYSYPDGKGHKFVGPCHYSIIGFDEKWSWTNAYGFKLDVSHWMPLPEPPKEN